MTWFSGCDQLLAESQAADCNDTVWRALAFHEVENLSTAEDLRKSYHAWRHFLKGSLNLSRHTKLHWASYIRIAFLLIPLSILLYGNYHLTIGLDHMPFIILLLVALYAVETTINRAMSYLAPNFVIHPPRNEELMGLKMQESRRFLDMFRTFSQGRRFGMATKGAVGWVPVAAQEADEIVLIQGTQRPLVLRPVGEDFTLVGTAYLVDCPSPADLRRLQMETREIRIV